MDQIVITVTAYTAFGRLQVLITEKDVDEHRTGYRLVANESIEMVDTSTHPVADALSQLGIVVWQAAERLAQLPF